MKKVKCKKSFKGMIDIRDYDVKAAIKENVDVSVTCPDFVGIAVYTPAELAKPERVSGEFKSMYDRNYKLYSYTWKQ